MIKKIFPLLFILLIAVLIVLFFSQNSLLTFILLSIIYFIKIKFYSFKLEIFWFIGLVISSAIVEVILVNFANTWVYTNPDFLNIPYYPPIFWALMITTIISLNKKLSN